MAGILTLGAAHGADQPLTKNDTVAFVKVCSDFGPGFFHIPDSGTCVKLADTVRDYRAFGEAARDRCLELLDRVSRFAVNGRLGIDWRLLHRCEQENADTHSIAPKNGSGGALARSQHTDLYPVKRGTAGYTYPF